MNTKEVYESADEAAAAIGVRRATVQDWLKTGRLPGKRVPVSRGGRPKWRIQHADLVAAYRGSMLGDTEPQQSLFDSTGATSLDPLTLQVVWPLEHRHEPFSPSMLTGYSRFQAVTYSVSVPMILKLLSEHDYEDFEVIFGSEDLTLASDLGGLVTAQLAIDEALTMGFVGLGGVEDPKTRLIMDKQASGQARFLTMSNAVVHSKLYILESGESRRVLIGSANLSGRALSGKQGELLLAFDDDEWMWDIARTLYDALRAMAETPIRAKPEIKPSHLVSVEDMPLHQQVSKTQQPVDVYIQAPSDMPGNAVALAARSAQLDGELGQAFREHAKPAPGGKVTVTPAVLHKVKQSLASFHPAHREVHHRLSRPLDGRFLYDDLPIGRPGDDEFERIWHDADLIIRYINNYREFGTGAENLQRQYFAVMGWLYFSPFMDQLRRERDKEGPGNFDCKPIALIYGPSNCGKTFIVTFLLKSMLGHQPIPLGDNAFKQTAVFTRQAQAGLCPLFYDDVRSTRFTSGRGSGADSMGEAIVKRYDRLHHEIPAIPCLIASLNSAAREFSNEVRKRAFMVYASTPLPSDNAELAQRMEHEAKQLHNRIGTSFYAEYLHRMAEKMAAVRDWASFDYLDESTGLLMAMFREGLREDEEMPKWCRRISSKEYDDLAWEPKRFQMKARLDRKLHDRNFPPMKGRWTTHGTDIVIGVENLWQTFNEKEIPDHIIHREACNGNNLHLWREQTEAFIRRGAGDGQWKLPTPSVLARLVSSR